MTAGERQLIEAILESVGLERLESKVRKTYQVKSKFLDKQSREENYAKKMVERRRRLSNLSP